MLPLRSRARSLALPLLGVIFTAFVAWPSRTSDARVQARAPEGELATLGALHADPLAALGLTVRVRFQLDQPLASWNPYLTRFGADEYVAVRAWADEQFLWRSDEWEHPLATLFARRGSAAARELENTPKYARFEARACVRQVFLGRPWIELFDVVRLQQEVDEASLLHAGRATLLIASERWGLAIEDIDSALAGNLPAHARDELWRLRAACGERAPR